MSDSLSFMLETLQPFLAAAGLNSAASLSFGAPTLMPGKKSGGIAGSQAQTSATGPSTSQQAPAPGLEADLIVLAERLQVKLPKDKRLESIVKVLYNHCQNVSLKTLNLRAADDGRASKYLANNYFGLPIYALNRTSGGMVYHSRKPVDLGDEESGPAQHAVADDAGTNAEDAAALLLLEAMGTKKNNFIAQRKVAKALLAIASNPATAMSFVLKGGMDAIVKLVHDSADPDTLFICAQCLSQSALTPENRKHMLDRQILSITLARLIEKSDSKGRASISHCIARLSYENGLEAQMLADGMLIMAQTLLNGSAHQVICYSILSLSNVAKELTGADAESLIRSTLGGLRKLDFQNSFEDALFVAHVGSNLSRIPHYVVLLTDEGLLPLVVSLIEAARPDWGEIVEHCVEVFINLSMMRKNRRDIANCGIGNQLRTIFKIGSGRTRAFMLMVLGNLLSSGLFQDKLNREETIADIIAMLDPAEPKQFIGAAYCICHMSMNEISSVMMVHAFVIPRILAILGDSAVSMESSTKIYLWTSLVNLSIYKVPFRNMVVDPRLTYIISGAAAGDERQREVATSLMLNISGQPEVHADLLPGHLFENVIIAFKRLFTDPSTPRQIRIAILGLLTNLGIRIPDFLVYILGSDLIQIMEDFGVDDDEFNHRFVELLCLISAIEVLCPRMVDQSVQRLLMALFPKLEESGKDLVAVVLHNLSMKRALVGSGVLNALLSSTRNCKTIRILHCCRAIAYMSSFSKSRTNLAKEGKIIPRLSNIMRLGVEQAERVQHYCGIAICNVTSSHIDRLILDDLVSSGAIVDLVVVTLLRVNDVRTKEALGKGLFNLLSRADYRIKLVEQLSVFEALLDLGRIELPELLELSINTAYNISCETSQYAVRMEALKVPSILVGRLTGSVELQGCKATPEVKMQCGKAMANMSYDNTLAIAFSRDKLIAEACFNVLGLKTEEAMFCCCVTIYNFSKLEDCFMLANTLILPCLVNAVSTGPIICVQLAIAAICNFSRYSIFHEQLTNLVPGPLIKVLSSPQVTSAVKLDIINAFYNVVTEFDAARARLTDIGFVPALIKACKTIDSEETLSVIGRIVRELCQYTAGAKVLLSQGIMTLMLRLAKLEIPLLKVDIADALYTLSTTSESLKLLKMEAVHILFWLTLYDCLALNDVIMKYASRTLRNFSTTAEDALVLSEEDRFFHVVKALSKRGNIEEVVFQTSACLYNMLNLTEEIKISMVKRGVIQAIFDLTASGYVSVLHLCSATLHTITDYLPNVDNPVILQLITSLLDAETDELSQMAQKSTEELGYEAAASPLCSPFEHTATGFKASWVCLTCDLDKLFKPAIIVPNTTRATQIQPANLATVVQFDPPIKLTEGAFHGFEGASRPQPHSVAPLRYVDSSGQPQTATRVLQLDPSSATVLAQARLPPTAEEEGPDSAPAVADAQMQPAPGETHEPVGTRPARAPLARGSTTGHIEGRMAQNGGNIYFNVDKPAQNSAAPDEDGPLLPPLTAVPAPGKPVSTPQSTARPSAPTRMPTLSKLGVEQPSVDETSLSLIKSNTYKAKGFSESANTSFDSVSSSSGGSSRGASKLVAAGSSSRIGQAVQDDASLAGIRRSFLGASYADGNKKPFGNTIPN